MKPKVVQRKCKRQVVKQLMALSCAALLFPGSSIACSKEQPAKQEAAKTPAEQPAAQAAGTIPAAQPATQEAAAAIPVEQLDSLVAPIALYPDPLLSQTLVASTYPLEIMQLQQWLARNPGLKDKALSDAVMKQPWDPSVQAMAALPDVVKRLSDDIQWTTDLGNAFLAQQTDVMDAVQRMRVKAQGKGTLQSNQQQKVETQVVESKSVIVIEQASPEVVYVPSYNPTVVYGEPYAAYPYPPIYYPPYPYGGVVAASAISFGVGMAIGAAWGGGGWGWGCGWGGNDININRNNSFNRNTNIQGGNRTNISGGNKWQHNPSHRGGAPYGDRGTANKFGGTARGDSLANRQQGARNQVGRQGGNLSSAQRGDRGGAGAGTRPSTTGSRGGAGDRAGTTGSRSGAGDLSSRGGGGRGCGGGAGSRSSSSRGSGSAGGGDRVGNRSVSSGSKSSGFGGSSGGFSGGGARASSSRGSSSMSRSSGGFSGGGSRGGGGGARGGGGGRR